MPEFNQLRPALARLPRFPDLLTTAKTQRWAPEEVLRALVEAEIAAHLGEVLWAQGRQEEARKLWQEASGRQPDNETLRKTLARLQVRL